MFAPSSWAFAPGFTLSGPYAKRRRWQPAGEPGEQVASVSCGAPRPSVGSSARADAGRANAAKASRLAMRHPWRRDTASTIGAQIHGIRIDPRPITQPYLDAIDAG